jgi:hypothetical protein
VYVIVRKDLPEPHRTVQACHAAIAATFSYGKYPQPHLVLCGADNEAALAQLFNELKDQGVPCCSYSEPDFVGCQLTAVATAPLQDEQRKPLRRLPLLKSN